MEVKKIPIKKIMVNRALLPRTDVDPETVERYGEIPAENFPPILVFQVGDEYVLAGGLHRLRRHLQEGHAEVEAEVRHGSDGDLIWAGIADNSQHGLPLTQEQRRRAIELILADPELKKRSDGEIAEHVGVATRTAGRVRRQFEADSDNVRVEVRVGRDGRTQDTSKIGRGSSSKPTPDDSGEIADEEIPEFIRPALEAQGKIDSILSDIASIATRVRGLDGALKTAGLFQVEPVLRLLSGIRGMLMVTQPQGVCPECGGDGCKMCNHRGWVVRDYADKRDPTPAMRKVLEKRGIELDGLNFPQTERIIQGFATAEGWSDSRKTDTDEGVVG